MQNKFITPEDYIDQLPEDRKLVIQQLRQTILENIPDGFIEEMSYGMIGYVVPHSLYPKGYHCNPKLPLPFVNIASQKKHIALYHMGLYADKELHDWFTITYHNQYNSKLDFGKSCIRFKNFDKIPYQLIGELIRKINVENWIERYELAFKK